MAISEEDTTTVVEILGRADLGERQQLAFALALAETDQWRAKRITMESGSRRKPEALMFVTNDPETIRRVRQLLAAVEAEEDAAELGVQAQRWQDESGRGENFTPRSSEEVDAVDPLTARWYPPEGGADATRTEP